MAAKPPGTPKADDEDETLGYTQPIPPLVPEGEYVGVFRRVGRGRFERRERLFLWFQISTPGPHLKKELYLVCPCPEENKAFGLGSKLMAAYYVAVGHLPRRRDRISTSVFKSKMFRFSTRTVTKNKDGKPRPPADYYSVIRELLSVEAT